MTNPVRHATPLDPTAIVDWVFDLDNTLYPRHCDLFSQIDLRMTAYVARLTGLRRDEARRLQKRLYRDHGTTLNGLMLEYHIDPHDYLTEVHDIDYSVLEPNPLLGEAIAALPGRKHVFTNGDVTHAKKTLAAIGVQEAMFFSIFDIVASDFAPKPERRAFDLFVEAHTITPDRTVMFEDMPRNLETAKQMGMTTVLVTPKPDREHKAEYWEIAGRDAPHVDHATDDIGAFLSRLFDK
ncbi:MAG: pyrimidine 5'-nucleotidase [Salaquimonas sp.]|nr:pyrimidine 5'-nucleotidase [Salaquimonas sp.]